MAAQPRRVPEVRRCANGKVVTVRAVAAAGLTPGISVLPMDQALRDIVVESVRTKMADTWVGELARDWRCNGMPLRVAGHTSSRQYGVARMATTHHRSE